jgi:ABC-2 type transport system ATP-binding protein
MIEVANVSKSYGQIEALKDVICQIAEGEIVGLLGPNGAGKTTLIKILAGYLQPDTGEARIDGLDVMLAPLEVQARIGYLPENAPLYPELSVQSSLLMMAELRQIPEEEQLECISEAVYATGLQDHLTRPVGQLSKGFRQRLGLAQAILHQPKLLILDEPTVGLDPTQIVEIRKLIKRLARHSTILFSTHILPEVEALCDRVIILMNGEIKADARLSELAATTNVVLVLERDEPGMEAALMELDNVQRVERVPSPGAHQAYRVFGETGGELSYAIFRLASERNWPVRELKYDLRTLETVFNELAVAA